MPATLRTLALLLVAAVALAIATPPAAAAPEPSGDGTYAKETVGAIPTAKQGLATGITALVVFAIVAAFLGAFVWPKIGGALDERANKIREEIEAAEAARKQARDALEQYEASLAEARAEARQMIEQARADQQKLAAELRARADAEVAAMKERALRDIDSARKQALSEIYSDAAALATAAAGKILKREINPGDQRELVEESLRQLQTLHN